jgi:hypothetical protein
MPRSWLNQAIVPTVLAYLFANTPLNALLAQTCPLGRELGCNEACVANDPCRCCHGNVDLYPSSEGRPSVSVSCDDEAPPCKNDRDCPLCPCGQHGCCWCSVAKTICGVASSVPAIGPNLCLGQVSSERTILLPPGQVSKLIRPPII